MGILYIMVFPFADFIIKKGNITGFAHPCGLAITQKGHLIVVEGDINRIAIIDTANWKKVRSFGRKGAGKR